MEALLHYVLLAPMKSYHDPVDFTILKTNIHEGKSGHLATRTGVSLNALYNPSLINRQGEVVLVIGESVTLGKRVSDTM